MNTRLIAFFAAVLLGFGFGHNAFGQGRSRCVFVDLFSSSNIVSVNYDTRFRGTDVYGWRGGIGLSMNTTGKDDFNAFLNFDYCSGISIPVGVNALYGRGASKFEVGIGINPTIILYRETRTYYLTDEDGDRIGNGSEHYGPTKLKPGCAFSVDLGYRLQRSNGFCFRVGISPTLEVNSYHTGANVMSVFPYVGFGYAFK